MSILESARDIIRCTHALTTQSYYPEEVENPSFETAKELDSNGDWKGSARHNITILRHSELGSLDRAKALWLLSQIYINQNNFRLANRCLNTLEQELPSMNNDSATIALARINEKRAWIADDFGQPELQLDYLQHANIIASSFQTDNDTLKIEQSQIFDTATHFSGRAKLVLANRIPNMRNQFIESALLDFDQCLASLQANEYQPANMGFQHLQKAHARLMQGDTSNAKILVELMGIMFRDYELSHPKSGILAQYHVMSGVVKAADAQQDFKAALSIRLSKENYPIGEARARAGIAATALAQGDLVTFAQQSLQTLVTSRLILLQR